MRDCHVAYTDPSYLLSRRFSTFHIAGGDFDSFRLLLSCQATKVSDRILIELTISGRVNGIWDMEKKSRDERAPRVAKDVFSAHENSWKQRDMSKGSIKLATGR